MLNGKKIVVVMPAYNAEKTLEQTYSEIAFDIIDEIILTDDNSSDKTKELAKSLDITTIVHKKNKGYGGNQKSCYQAALNHNADIVIMLHPDYQYTPNLLVAMAAMLCYNEYDVALASRMLNNSALAGNMPKYKFIANKFLTTFQNFFTHLGLSEYHTGFRAFTKEVLTDLPLNSCDDDFIFDNEILCLAAFNNYRIGEITCPTKYFKEASSINFVRSCKYGIGVLLNSLKFFLAKKNIYKSKIYRNMGDNRLDIKSQPEFYWEKQSIV